MRFLECYFEGAKAGKIHARCRNAERMASVRRCRSVWNGVMQLSSM
jgi:hypothetical protein